MNGTATNGSNVSLASGTGDAVFINASANYAVSGDTYRGGDSAYAIAAAINATGVGDIQASASTTITGAGAMAAVASTADASTYSLSVNGVDIYNGEVLDNGDSLAAADIVNQINLHSDDTGVTASLGSTSNLILTAADGRNITFTEATAGTITATTLIGNDASFTSGTTERGTIQLTSASNITIGGTGHHRSHQQHHCWNGWDEHGGCSECC